MPDLQHTTSTFTGLGTSAARFAARLGSRRELGPPHPENGHDPAYAHRPWGDGTASPLYCPLPERIDDALAEEVDRRLALWAQECGFTAEEAEQLGRAEFGRLVVLAHPDCDDPDRLLISAKLNAAWWAADDLYSDDTALGAVPAELPQRLALAMAAMDPLPAAGEFTGELDEALGEDRVLVALRSGMEYLSGYSTPAQFQRVCYSTFTMFVSWTAYAAWQHNGKRPPAWEYLAARQHDSFYTSMTLVDVLGGYELDSNLFYEPAVRRAAILAGTASVLVNDLHSVTKDLADENPPCNMVLQVAADRECSVEEAVEVVVGLHNGLVRDFQDVYAATRFLPSPQLRRFMRGLRAWMGGGFEWHSTSPRYRTEG
ncbi:family 2 encapsulin nanocompartment cargo protein terpene cyclase [Umezawaea sp. Da 62-37]|uniref:family 2 encapsulin nanocompartment cargo protein terpene cyclase n=1 Tax=Umezawaea sp. Da 62-37 TaxID=3075927 RepID=UPI0028F6EFE3|nr:family 2 encapsulin nanocompartment cargo protein terpene cyclase [Umezawaea sp. Da 62-37]WNV85772.1 family 2 encapsulin nanocompartment cargo protein terpene cyclase [Umezawaea sp. Da 62-37]